MSDRKNSRSNQARGKPNTSHERETLLAQLVALHEEMQRTPLPTGTAGIHPTYAESARNLLSYLALRRHDIRPLQIRLARQGLSSLGRSEASIDVALSDVIGILECLIRGETQSRPAQTLNMEQAERLLAEHTRALFGNPPAMRDVRIMVTMPTEAAWNYAMIHDLLAAGMNCMRINCAHDDAATWQKMIEHLRHAGKTQGKACQIMMDLAGPKLRTGNIDPGPAVRRIRPKRDSFGRVTHPARVWLSAEEDPTPAPAPADACLQLPGEWLHRRKIGDTLTLRDARKSRRRLHIVDASAAGCWAELRKTAYVIPGLPLRLQGGKRGDKARIAPFASGEQTISLWAGDTLILTHDMQHGHPATLDSSGQVLTPATIGCTLPEVFAQVRAGEPIWFDDGKIGGVIESVSDAALRVRIEHAPDGVKLRSDKGINLPQTKLELDALTAEDRQALNFAARHADVIELSFVNRVADVHMLFEQLERLDASDRGVVLKIETRCGFENLPALLLAGMHKPRFGVMIARGDLAVESGFERLAELQEEILCLCEAAHVPVIWATQVLETLAKTGAPSRAEITDAAMGVRADCVMLNKGPHILKAVHTLDDLLRRMRAHHNKKRDLLRKLQVAHQPALAGTGTDQAT
ncbi:pyruvate kinase [Azomonas macrocytogenes]|uniref:pyruvate kinase n=1 Tax=Azomonas macrocytogenes TaxID=69962 RepID=A0A839T626_AZOMA|nr:pyruvate kinase [Azomonas macrocytogenes]MBB3103385.1 pyruvate kinase [Azomonas macrocytogenes]